ncbi:hypothetical protein FRC01_014218 [Tulasnella sp. 417]|nr:hypothetical protein FRC01_014218 [Tulasnella sp. 417]
MIDLNGSSNVAKQVVYLIVAAIGTGCLFQTPLMGMQAAMPQKDIATVTSTFGLVRQIGGTIGISASGSVYVSFLRRRLDDIQGFDASRIPNGQLINNVGSLHNIQPESVRVQVIGAYATSLSSIWLICTPLVGLAALLSFFVRGYSLKRGIVREQANGKPAANGGEGTTVHEKDVERAANGDETTPTKEHP